MSNYKKDQPTKKPQSPTGFAANRASTAKDEGKNKSDTDRKNADKKGKDDRRN